MKVKNEAVFRGKAEHLNFEWFYVVNIVNMYGNIHCEIIEYEHSSVAKVINPHAVRGGFVETKKNQFDLFTVLGDLIRTIEMPNKCKNHPFFFDYDITNMHPTDEEWNSGYPYPIKPKYLWSNILNCVVTPKEVKRIISNKSQLSLEVIENLKLFYKLNIQYERFHNPERERSIKQKANWNQPNIDYPSTPWNIAGVGNEWQFNHNMDFEGLLQGNESKNYRYEYTCHTIADIAFSVLHYLIKHKYSFAMCKHCGGYFATNKPGTDYCNRMSPLVGYEDKTCYKARKAVWDKLQKKKKTIREWLSKHINKLEEFDKTVYGNDNSGGLEALVKNAPTPENIQRYHDFLYIDCETIHKKYQRVRQKA